MLAMLLQLLLSSDIKSLEDWLAAIVVWVPQVIGIVLAAALLGAIMHGLRRYWIRWVLMWVPYLLIGWALDDAVDMERGNYEFNNLLSLLDHDSNFRILWLPLLLAVPFLLVLHVILFIKQAQCKGRPPNQCISR
ncbi:hypothetical protein [Hymenobacter sp. UYP22]|uniref:hypothetical protein n=1 Tax=Hymenobacter sp. UYP22 TaxID=3156348 RepID=UPI0033973CDA